MTAGGRRPRVSGAALPGGGDFVRQLLASNQGAQSNLRPRLYGPWCLTRMASNLYLETALKTSLMNVSGCMHIASRVRASGSGTSPVSAPAEHHAHPP